MSEEFRSSDFVAQIRGGILEVSYTKEHELSVTRADKDGNIEELIVNRANADESESKMLTAMDRMPAFSATYQGNGEWSCDIDAGFQRWRGHKSGRAVGMALRSCGFDATTISMILKTARKHTGVYCPRQW